jgi:hypothetical protein
MIKALERNRDKLNRRHSSKIDKLWVGGVRASPISNRNTEEPLRGSNLYLLCCLEILNLMNNSS